MPDAASLSTLIGSINQAIGIGKFLRDTDKAFEQAEFRIKMSDLVDRLVDLKEQLQTNREENIELRAEVLRLKEALAKKSEVVFEVNKYWVNLNGEKHGPYCQKCYDKDGKLIRLQQDEVQGYGHYWRCTTCTESYDYPKIDFRRYESEGGLSNWM